MKSRKRHVPSKITVDGIEQEIKRALSQREIVAISNLRGRLPDDRRKRKRMIRKAREAARIEDLKDPEILSARGEPSDVELREAIAFLSTWQTPDDFANKLRRLRRRIPMRRLMTRPYKFVLEGIILSTFSEHRKLRVMRLAEDPPDARVRFEAAGDESVEITEALDSRKRGHEFKAGSFALLEHYSDDEIAEKTEQMLKRLEEAIQAKTKKYPTPPRLVVYFNFPHDESVEKRIGEVVEELRKQYGSEFIDIHVLTDRRMY